MSVQSAIKRKTAPDIRARKNGEPIVMLTSYHAHTAALVDRHCDVILVGDSLGNVMHGFETTVPVTLDMMILQGHAVMRGSQHALVVVDMPFGSYEASKEQAFHSAVRILKETHCGAVKLEGGARMAETVAFLVRARRACDGPYRADAAIDQHARLVSRAGPRRGQLGPDPERRQGDFRRRRLLGRDRGCRRAAGAQDHADHRHSDHRHRRQRQPATGRCWCWRTCWACRRGRRNSFAATAISAPRSKRRSRATPATCARVPFRGPNTSTR